MRSSVQASLILAILLASCTDNATRGPYSLSEALDAGLPLPLYYPDPQADAQYSRLGATYYYFDLGDELRLDAYFTVEGSNDQLIRVARMSICTVCTLIGPPSEATGKQVLIQWAADSKGYTCGVLSDATSKEFVSGDAYQSCVFWIDKQGYGYKLYTIWSEDESVAFVNSLRQLSKNDDENSATPPQ